MTTKPNLENRLSELARLDALDAAAADLPDRIAQTLQQIAAYRSALRTPGTGRDLPDEDRVPSDRARDARDELIRLVLARVRALDGIRHIVDEWAPRPVRVKAGDTENSMIWCVNHLKHGEREPAAKNGRRNCEWCCDWNKRLRLIGLGKDTWPNKEMIDLHARGIKVTETIARRIFKKPAA